MATNSKSTTVTPPGHPAPTTAMGEQLADAIIEQKQAQQAAAADAAAARAEADAAAEKGADAATLTPPEQTRNGQVIHPLTPQWLRVVDSDYTKAEVKAGAVRRLALAAYITTNGIMPEQWERVINAYGWKRQDGQEVTALKQLNGNRREQLKIGFALANRYPAQLIRVQESADLLAILDDQKELMVTKDETMIMLGLKAVKMAEKDTEEKRLEEAEKLGVKTSTYDVLETGRKVENLRKALEEAEKAHNTALKAAEQPTYSTTAERLDAQRQQIQNLQQEVHKQVNAVKTVNSNREASIKKLERELIQQRQQADRAMVGAVKAHTSRMEAIRKALQAPTKAAIVEGVMRALEAKAS